LRTGSIFLAICLLVVAAIVVFAATIGGRLGIGTRVGRVLNGVLLFGLGYICRR